MSHCSQGKGFKSWRPITITSVLYPIIFCRITDALHTIHEENGINICDKEQKGFIKKRAGCIEHTAVINALIIDAVSKKDLTVYIIFGFKRCFWKCST
jgi:hypothetical protein